MKLVIGNKNYSSWSLRPWLLLHAHGLDFEEVSESLRAEGLSERLAQHSPSRRVPVLIDGDLTVWDSLAICEYVSEHYLLGEGWPENATDRALARSLTAQMHAGFNALRNEMPMNCRARRKISPSDAALDDVAQIDALWSEYARPDGDGRLFLFGQFSIADCFYAPVVLRFETYGISLSPAAQAYADSLRAHPSLQHWVAAGRAESEVVVEDEAGEDA